MKRAISIIVVVLLIVSFGCKSKQKVLLTPEERGSAKQIYEKATKFLKRNPDKSRLLFKEVIQLFPDSSYAQRAKIGIADSYYKQKDASSLIVASAEYQEYVNLYPNSPDAVYAKLQVGMCYYKQMRKAGRDQTNTFTTIKAFESMIKQYPGTREAEEAKKILEKAKHTLATHYFLIGLSNFRSKAYKGAVNRFKQVINEFPEFKKNDKLFYFTGKCYYATKQYDSSLSFFRKIISSYPKSRYLKKSQKMILKINSIKSEKGGKKQ